MKLDRMLAVSLFVLSSGYLALTFLIPEPSGAYAAVGPRAFPFVIGIGLIGCALWIGLSEARSLAAPIPVDWRLFVFSAMTFLAYVLLLEPVGYLLATVGFITLESRLLGSHDWLRNLILSVVITASVYGVFNLLLDIRLPEGLIG